MSGRVTRSSAKQSAARSSLPSQQDSPLDVADSPSSSSRPTRKRKAPNSSSPAGSVEDSPNKRAKLAASSPLTGSPASRSSNRKRRPSTPLPSGMSTSDNHQGSPPPENQQAHGSTSSSTRKKSSKNKKPLASSSSTPKSQERPPSASAPASSKHAQADDGDPAETPDSPEEDEDEDEEQNDDETGLADQFAAGLPGLLGRRGAGSAIQDLRAMSSLFSGSSRFTGLLAQLQQTQDPDAQFSALEQLSELLLMSNEDNLASGRFAPDAFVPELVTLMQPGDFGENPEIMNLACRCIANMVEALPASVGAILRHGAIPVLVSKLQSIEYMDLAEQALSTLEKISADVPHEIVRSGGLTACLTYLDFFPTSTQRSAVTIAANCSRSLPSDAFSEAKDVMPILLNVLNSSDQKVMEQGCVCISRVVESFKHQPGKLEDLVSPDLLRAILRLLLPGSTNLIGPNIHTQFLRVLSSTASASRRLTIEMFKMNIVDTLYQILTGVSPPSGTDNVAQKIDSVVIMQALIHRPKDHVFETLNVICELLPPLDDASMSYMAPLIETVGGASLAALARNSSKSVASEAEHSSQKPDLMQSCADELKRFAIVLLPTLTDAYASTVNFSVRQRVLTAHLKMLSNLPVEILEPALKPVPYASFLAAILSQLDHPFLVTAALQASALLMKRLEPIYRYQFYREGVFAEIKKIADRPLLVSEPTKSSKKTEKDPEKDGSQTRSSQRASGDAQNNSRASRDENRDDDDEENEDQEDDIDDSSDEENGRDVDEMDEDDDDGADSDDSMPSVPVQQQSHSTSDATQDLVTGFAKSFIEQFEASAPKAVRNKANQALYDLQTLVHDIVDCYDNRAGEGGKELFAQLASYFEGDALESMTSYELLTSKVVDSLLDIFQVNPDAPHVSTAAKAAFVESFMGTSLKTHVKTAGTDSPTTPFSVLVQKLQDLLSRAEHFEVTTVYHNAFENNRSNAASMLAKQLRVKLIADGDKSGIPSSFRFIKVTIHAIATFQALNEYLQPKLALAEAPSVLSAASGLSSRPGADLSRGASGTISGPLAASDGKQAPDDATRRASGTSRHSLGASPSSTQSLTERPRSKRSERRAKSQRVPESAMDDAAPDAEGSKGSGETLECADETRIENPTPDVEDEDTEMSDAMEQIVNELEEEAAAEQDPSAVNMEVGSTGKVTARTDSGDKVPTPTQTPTPASRQQPPASRSLPSSLRSLLPGMTGRSMSYANIVKSPPTWHLEFSIDGKPITHETTIYGAVQTHQSQDSGTGHARYVWSNEHTIHFRRAEGATPTVTAAPSSPDIEALPSDLGLPPSLEKNPVTASILRLLRILHAVNANLDDVLAEDRSSVIPINPEPVAQFVNTKLTAKLNRQLEEPLIVASNCLPGWSEDLARLYPFLFPFETRHLFLQSTSFGYSRSMTRWQNAQPPTDSRRAHHHERPNLGRLQRQKIRIQRPKMLESAIKVMELYGSRPHLLEIEYSEEVGTGLGPTLEFYSTVSKEFSKKKLRLWRENESARDDSYAFGKHGLFPAPMSDKQIDTVNGQRVLNLFKTLGIFVARSMLDSRIIDVAFNPTFFRVDSSDNAVKPSLGAVKAVDDALANSLQTLKQFATIKKKIEENERLTDAQRARKIAGIQVAGASIDDLGLDFTLPGYPGIELIENGSNVNVTIENVSAYVEQVIDYTLRKGVIRQVEAFRAGFSQVFPYSALRAFTPDELVMLFGRSEEDWSLETLMDSIKADHGYNLDSGSVRNLLQIMSEMSQTERRDFLQFVTGSPKLPIGGFKALTPMLTIVLRPAEAGSQPDATLPSVMTCQNYVKLPDFSSLEVMRARLMMAIKEGAGAFHLS